MNLLKLLIINLIILEKINYILFLKKKKNNTNYILFLLNLY